MIMISIRNIFTLVAPLPAMRFLEEHGVAPTAFDCVANILTKNKSAVCPGELIAIHANDTEQFIKEIKGMYAQSAIGATQGLIIGPSLNESVCKSPARVNCNILILLLKHNA